MPKEEQPIEGRETHELEASLRDAWKEFIDHVENLEPLPQNPDQQEASAAAEKLNEIFTKYVGSEHPLVAYRCEFRLKDSKDRYRVYRMADGAPEDLQKWIKPGYGEVE